MFHTRQQHTYKVAQVGRRLAEYCQQNDAPLASKLQIDAEVVEAASLAHDLGHPPFGHAGEHELNKLVELRGDSDGFEGNAQTFRILTKLAVRYPDVDGLNLTRATLSASLKYPWPRDKTNPGRRDKWGAYKVDEEDFLFARDAYPNSSSQTHEAALMDWADDISYSVHDLEDFHRVGAIPWAVVLDSKEALVENTFAKWFGASPARFDDLSKAFDQISGLLDVAFGPTLRAPYEGDRKQRVALRNLTSFLIGRFIQGTHLVDAEQAIRVDANIEAEVKLLKQIAKDYITSRPSLVAQQRGQRKLIGDIFHLLCDESTSGPPKFLPAKLNYLYELSCTSIPRFAADCISSMTEHEVAGMHARLFGSLAGSVLDPIVR